MPTHIEKIDDNDKWNFKPCLDRDHNPPMMIVIPQGSKMVHTCPSCGQTTTLYPTCVSW